MKFLSLVCFLLSVWGIRPACAADFEPRWRGVATEGGDAYFVTEEMATGDFDGDRRDEVLLVDADGVCHLLDWDGERLIEEWITSFSVSDGRTQDIVSAKLENGAASGVILAADGSLVVIRRGKVGFVKVCGDCLNAAARDRYQILRIAAAPSGADLRDGIIAVAQSKGDLYLLPLRWSRGQFNVVNAQPFDPGMSPQGIFPSRTDRVPVETFYAYGARGGRRAMMTRIVADEEGMVVDRAWTFPGEDFTRKPTQSVDFRGDGHIELLTLGTRTVKPAAPAKNPPAKKPVSKQNKTAKPAAAPKNIIEARVFSPGKTEPDETFPVVLPSPSIAGVADLNGDGEREVLFGNYAGVFEIYARPVREVEVNGRRMPLSGRVLVQGKKIFVNAELLGRVTTEHGDWITLRNNSGQLDFDMKTTKVQYRARGEEEAQFVAVPYKVVAGKLYLSVDAAAHRMGFDWQWDPIAARLRISDTGREGRSPWPRTR